MVQGPRSNRMYCWNDKEGGFSASDEFQNPLFDSFDSNNNSLCGFQSSDAVPNQINLIGSNQQVAEVDAFQGTSPLGLTLSKTPSFLNLVEMSLSQGRNTNCTTETETNRCSEFSDHYGVRAKMDDFVGQPASEKLKASNFPALSLRIGSWERVSRHEGELVAKCYYAKRKLVWEVLEGALKSKIEIQWSDISAIRATINDDEPGILEIEVNQPPIFYRESNPQPRKHTLWQQAPDFTGGQAPIFRRHYVKFPPGSLDKHYNKLLQCDNHLFMLSQRPFPSLESPYFLSNLEFTEFSFDFNGRKPEMSPGLQFPLSGPCHQFQNFEPKTEPSFCIKDSMSPMSDESISNHGVESPRTAFWGQDMNNGLNQVQVLPSIASANQSHPAFSCQDYHLLTYGEGAKRPRSNNRTLSDIENHLLSDSQVVCSDEKAVLARVNSMCSLLDQSEVVNPANNIGIQHMDYRITVDPLVRSTTTEDFNGNDGLLQPQPISWLPPQVTNEDLLLMHLSRNNSLYPFAFPTPMMEDFASADNVNEVNHWT